MSPTKEELAEEATIAELKKLGEEHGVDLSDATHKQDYVDAITASGKVTKADIDAIVNRPEPTSSMLPDVPSPQAHPPDFHQLPVIRQTHWVRLGTGRNVPKHLRGHIARILVAPIQIVGSGAQREYQPEDTVFQVQTRDIYEERLELKRADFMELHGENRPSS